MTFDKACGKMKGVCQSNTVLYNLHWWGTKFDACRICIFWLTHLVPCMDAINMLELPGRIGTASAAITAPNPVQPADEM